MKHEPRAPGLPDLVILGDSHTAALHQAALARGLDARLLYLSGNFWHEGKIRFHPGQGLSAAYRPPLQRSIRALASELGGTVLPPGVPVIASFGYHLGRLVPPFARHGHTPDEADFDDRPDALFVSQAFFDQWLHHNRGALLRVLRQAARAAQLVVVAPPVIHADPVSRRVAAAITAHLREHGVAVFDPRSEPGFGPDPLDPAERTADGVHGTPAYGARVLAALLARGLIPART